MNGNKQANLIDRSQPLLDNFIEVLVDYSKSGTVIQDTKKIVINLLGLENAIPMNIAVDNTSLFDIDEKVGSDVIVVKNRETKSTEIDNKRIAVIVGLVAISGLVYTGVLISKGIAETVVQPIRNWRRNTKRQRQNDFEKRF
jgi:hypothetical protein